METTQSQRATPSGIPLFFRCAIPLLWAIAILSAIFALLIFFVPIESYRHWGNIFEVAVAVFCMACCLYAYRTISGRICLLLAAFAFMTYALTNAFWYLFTQAFGRSSVFTPVSELGFICVFLFLIAAISLEFTDSGMGFPASAGLFELFLLLPIFSVIARPDLQPVRIVLLFVRIIVIEQLFVASIRYRVFRYPVLWAGICLNCIASILYALRETVFSGPPLPLFPGTGGTMPLSAYDFLSIIGPMTFGSFALILAGLFIYIEGLREERACREPEPC